MVGSGLVKLASGDPTWHSLAALAVHYETQPLPTPLAWYAHQLPAAFHRASTAAVLGIELFAPWLMFAPRRLKALAFILLVGLQVVIALTGNYAFFNLLSAALCVFLLDDAVLASTSRVHNASVLGAPGRAAALLLTAFLTVPVSALTFASTAGVELPGWPLVLPAARLIAPLRLVNGYGLFAVMTTTRPEIIIEGSNDGEVWLPYEFKYKPGDVSRRPMWVAPHQPRLDWQMWFAALGRYDEDEWFGNLCARLLQGSPAVLRLLAHNPFADHPPRYVRSVLYRYHFSDRATRRLRGDWWTRDRLGLYAPVMSAAP
jgi:lipase maturation factor 1